LKSVATEIQDLIFNNMTKLGAKMLREDKEYMGPVRLNDVQESQREINKLARARLSTQEYQLIDKILSNIINLEADQDKKTLKTIQKEAVLEIQAGDNPRILAVMLNSYVNFGFEETITKYLE